MEVRNVKFYNHYSKEDIEFEIELLKDLIASFERTIKKFKKLPATRKRNLYVKELESRIDYRKDKIEVLEIQKEILETR